VNLDVSLLLASAVALSAPLLFAALGELISERAGVINIGLEAMMLAGAFAAVFGAHRSGSIVLGFAAAAVAGMLVASVHGLTCFVFQVNQVVTGVVLNILVLGVTSFLLATLLDDVTQSVASLPSLDIPGLSELGFVGPILFSQDVMVYVAFAAIPVVWWVLNRTTTGLQLDAAGERPEAAESLGVSVPRVRWAALLTCGCLGGIGGAQLALAGVGFFTQNMTAGRGFIALAAVIFGRWRPLGTAAAVLLFAVADAFQIRAQALGIDIPSQFLVMLPYVVTLVALTGLLRRMRPPAALGVNYAHD
jgi:general nucleoside transport system permease protein